MGLSRDVLQPLKFPLDRVRVEGLATAIGQHWASSGRDPSHTHTSDGVKKDGWKHLKQ